MVGHRGTIGDYGCMGRDWGGTMGARHLHLVERRGRMCDRRLIKIVHRKEEEDVL